MVGDIRDEANTLLAAFAPLLAPVVPINVHDAKVAVTALLRAIRNPGSNFPVINGLHTGQYLCHVKYSWRGVVVRIFQM
ncbi:hypothetical protein JG688_00004739 [Phytophthora aleatoria]|uniref:Uncharacterized protein n=1 Tax=Phytophthora aleatoria TaxID=2496075 RepID=A0A8J5IW96_9STRA|nr:hypothetical protein JG688_00004739 [Phytophthora aleatoria]